ncbi:chemotaxis protein CheW [Rhodopseudomonas sp. BAL398]|uniref:chemotaxis protein CheW n=1 Tax=Rhodopseudomonas sp. BAL398 TaxID=3034676 RepID=UPI0023E11700|nr:chemotaxis protein CheW [Rhodopseudomonas sp. BAL398]MDF3809087.1 chemotaxis protein CheW [Rhodopseudomonas sp. BAL398]
MTETVTPSGGRFLTFRSEGRLYAVAAHKVSEVVRMAPLARVPQAPKSLLGLANLRGAVVPVAGMRSLMGRGEIAVSDRSRLVVLGGAMPVALAVDEVASLVTIEGQQIQAGEADASAEAEERLQGVFQTGAGVTKILDIEALLARAFPREATVRKSSGGVAKPIATAAADIVVRRRLITFDVAGQEYALSLDAVREIVLAPDSLAYVPGSDEAVRGVMAYRDGLLPLLSLRVLLGLGGHAPQHSGKIIVTVVAGTVVGLIADNARSILSVDPRLIEPAPKVLSARAGGEARIQEIYRAGHGRLISILVAETLFREDVMQKLAQTTAQAAAGGAVADGTTAELRFLVFRLDGNEFALPIDAVDEVARVPEQITRLPKTPKFLEGVVNLRGTVLPVVDQRRRFDMPRGGGGGGRRPGGGGGGAGPPPRAAAPPAPRPRPPPPDGWSS